MPPLSTYLTAISILSSTVLAQIHIAIVPECYFPDGTLSPSYSGHSACNKGAAVKETMCCALGNRRTDDMDLCISNGLCLDSNGTYYRASCTDETWESEACLKICMDFVGPGGEEYKSSNAPVYFCDDGTVCCGSEAVGQACCQKGNGFELPIIDLSRVVSTVTIKFEPEPSTSTSTSPPTSTLMISTGTTETRTASTNPPAPSDTTNDPIISTTSSLSSSIPPPTSTSSKKGPLLPDTVTIAIAISVPVVSISLIISGILLWDRRRRRNHANRKSGIRITPAAAADMKSPVVVEIGSSDTRYEWPTAGQLEQYARGYGPTRYNHRPPTPVHHVNVYEMY
ncbi:hypothetical protein TWF506_006731 [Arthrobotrys conoides]|uniref:Mid2 domain-containing protein n=1 Tax=Arthrobotrys conoides TaxID=74498 RepID=A0AAN8NS92_9PEZI